MKSLTQLIRDVGAGSPGARDELFAAAYSELRKLARSRLRDGGRNTLIATTVLFGSVPWSKFSHMFFKPAAALEKRMSKANGSAQTLPTLTRPGHRMAAPLPLLRRGMRTVTTTTLPMCGSSQPLAASRGV